MNRRVGNIQTNLIDAHAGFWRGRNDSLTRHQFRKPPPFILPETGRVELN